ncbi:MAG: glycosyltransferase [Bacteroidota bacterium]
MTKVLSTVHGGISGFPYGNRAAINKQIAINKGLFDAGCHARVLNRKGVYTGDPSETPDASGIFEGIEFETATGRADRPKGFLTRNLAKIKGWRREVSYLKELRKRGELDAMILDSSHIDSILFYRWITRRMGIPLVYHYVEMRSKVSMADQKHNFNQRISNQTIDKYVHKLFDGILAISDVLAQHVKSLDPQLPTMTISALCDYTKFEIPRSESPEPFFLYCGAAAYSEVIKFVMDSFNQLNRPDDLQLYMIISGAKATRQAVYDYADSLECRDKIQFFYMIPYEELAQKYRDAKALLIPLRDTIQDKARFPHKVSEYLASQNPVVTTNYGELAKYFTDLDNGLVADSYNLDQYAEKLQWVIDNPQEAKAIGMRGYEMGRQNFHYQSTGVKVRDFLADLSGKSIEGSVGEQKVAASSID